MSKELPTSNDDPRKRLKQILRQFRRQSYRVRKTRPEGSLQVGISSSQDGQSTSLFTMPDGELEFAASVRPFLSPDSELEFDRVWAMVKESGLASAEETENVDGLISFLHSDSAGQGVAFVLNNVNVTPERIYHLVADGELFGEKHREAQLLKDFTIGPSRHIFQMAAHSFMATAADVLDQIVPIFKKIEDQLPREVIAPARCIYCLGDQGSFSSEEHPLPESMFGETLVLPPGAVCDQCNSGICAQLDKAMMAFPPLAFLRTIYLPQKKDGRFPSAKFGTFDVAKVGPRTLRFKIHGKRTPFRLVDGKQRLCWKGNPPDLHLFARALVRTGLAIVAYDHGVERAYDSFFEPARLFVRGEVRSFDGFLAVQTHFDPKPSLEVGVFDFEKATCLVGKFFGMEVAVNLSPAPLPRDHAEIPDAVPLHVVDLREAPARRAKGKTRLPAKRSKNDKRNPLG